MDEFKLPVAMRHEVADRAEPLPGEAPRSVAEALPMLTFELARGENPQALEDRVLATPALRPFSEDLVRVCGALSQGALPPSHLGPSAQVLSAIYNNATDEASRRAGMDQASELLSVIPDLRNG